MTTTETALLSQFSALSIAADAASTLSSFSSSPQGVLPGNDNGGGGPQGVNFGAGAAPTKAWRSPPRRTPGHEGAASMKERSSPSRWPVPSRGGAQGKKKMPQCSEKVVLPSPRPSGAPGPAATEAAGPSSSLESEQKELETWEEQPRVLDSVAVAPHRTELPPHMADNSSRTPRPPSPPTFRQQQWRPPQSGRRARNLQQFPYHNNDGNGSHQQQRPHRHWNTSPSHQRPANNGYYHPMNQGMMGLPSLPPGWGFNTMPVLQQGPNPHLAPPPGSMFSHGHFPGPYLPEAFPYAARPVSPILPPHPGWRRPWLTPPPPPPPRPPAEASLPSAQRQHPAENPQLEGEGVDVRLRRQIEYYFSDENLIKDVYLRRCMNNQGWVSIHTIAGFPRVKSLTEDIGLILGALRASATVEVSVDKVRRRSDWGKWIIQQHLSDAAEG